MIGLILLYFIGKTFYDLGISHERNAWGLGILGIVFYYLGAIVAGVFLAFFWEFAEFGSIDDLEEQALGFMAMPFGMLSCWLGYRFLDNHFSNKKDLEESDILDEGFGED